MPSLTMVKARSSYRDAKQELRTNKRLQKKTERALVKVGAASDATFADILAASEITVDAAYKVRRAEMKVAHTVAVLKNVRRMS